MPSSNEIRDRAVRHSCPAATQTRRRGRLTAEDVRSLVDDTGAEARGLAGVLSEAARTQVLALLGATDLARSVVGRRTEELPAEAARRAAALSGTALEGLSRAATSAAHRQAHVQSVVTATTRDVRDRGERTVGAARPANLATVVRTARHDAESRLAQARSTYTGLARRGERVLTDLRRDPRLLRVLGATDRAVQDVAGRVGEQAESVQSAAARDARSVSATRAAATRQHRTEARRQAATNAATKAAATRRARATEQGSTTGRETARTTTARTTTARTTTARTTTARKATSGRTPAAKTTARSGSGRRSGAAADRRTTR